MSEMAILGRHQKIEVPYAASTPAGSYNLPIGYLRTFVTVLVLAHHSVLAYHPFARSVPSSLVTPPRWQGFPVVDTQRWTGFSLFAGLNDVFFMCVVRIV